MTITSSEFTAGQPIPSTYTCQGKNTNPPLVIDSIPDQTQSLALIMDDPDAPSGTFTHWVTYNLPPGTTEITAHALPTGAAEGLNDSGGTDYVGPCPPSGTHRYYFRVWALDTTLNLPAGASRKQVESAMTNHQIGHAELMGTYQKH